jgi:hypothetical protein
MLIAIINQSTSVTNADVNIMCEALQIQFNLHVASAWNQKSPTVKFYSSITSVPGYAWVISVLDNPDVANALGYHDETNDKVDGFIFCQPVLQNGGVVLYDATNPQNVSVASVLSHEAIEMFGDRFANFWADGPNVIASDGYTYSEYALELCDPVEGNSYVVNVGATPVSMSNFIFPSWFNPEATDPVNMPFDYLHLLSLPFSMTTGGYMIVQQAGQAQQIFGEQMPTWKKELKKNEFSRASKR